MEYNLYKIIRINLKNYYYLLFGNMNALGNLQDAEVVGAFTTERFQVIHDRTIAPTGIHIELEIL